MSQRTGTRSHTWKERALSLLLTAVLLLGLAPGLTLPASAHWADGYLDQLVDWGVIRADQTANPDAPITRAEFMAIVNRAYGYTEKGPIPFTDVATTDWFYDDVSIAYTAGYMAGTSATSASPNATLTREQAVCILGRNMMLKSTPGESLAFADSRDVSDWARGTIKTAVDNYIVSGYPDNTFQPQASVSKAQMAVLITQCIGTPVSQSGSHELGGVFGNVTITSPNVTLRNTTISGDLYVSGGVGLGGIKLENVDVLGRIVVSSSGESEAGDVSVVMRNVNAREMLVDNMRNKTVTVRADGITEIANTIVRTSAYLEDNNTDDKGLLNITLEGEPGTHLTLAGRIKEVVDRNPGSTVQVAKGTVAKLTVDEAATNSTVQIDRNAEVKELNLDVATNVTGEGDIGQLNVNAPGCVVSMLPDKIYIRPGLTANIAGVVMDHTAAEEGSTDPRLLSGYPAAKDIAPTGFRADFSGNKKGTVYWAVSSISDGSIGEENLIEPPSYGSKAIQGGSVAVPAGDTVVNARVTGLTVAGSYYLSALLRDEQGRTSPVKVISFSTPDNTVPAFGQGYPYMSRITRDVAQVTVMPTKTCKLYYALLPQGAKAPTVNELKSAAVVGNLGYGVRDVTKNTEDVFTVNNQRLEELKNYVLYLWLTDVDGANSSAVQSLSFLVPDETPPEFAIDLHVNGKEKETSVPVAATLNENGTIFWAVVEEGADYPLPNMQSDPLSKDNEIDPETNRVIKSKLTSDYAKLCVKSGMGAISRGQMAAKANTEAAFDITGLKPEKAYDLYYMAQDTAGNYTIQVYKLSGGIHTLDVSGPVINQSFSSVPSRDDPNSPLSSTDIMLDISENIRCSTSGEGKDFLTLYNNRNASAADMKLFTDALKASIVLYRIDPESGGGSSSEVVTWNGTDPEPKDWVVNYSKVTVAPTGDGHILITFPGTGSHPEDPAVKLSNGAQYYFQFRDITDVSTAMNKLDRYNSRVDYSNAEKKHNIPTFTTVFSQVLLTSPGFDDAPEWKGSTVSGQLPSNAKLARMDLNFRMNPQSTENTDDSNRYDVLIYSDTSIAYDLYYRIVDKSTGQAVERNTATGATAGKALAAGDEFYNALIPDHDGGNNAKPGPDVNGWRYLGNKSVTATDALSLGHDFTGCTSTNYPQLNNLSEKLYYEFVISVTKHGTLTNYRDFSGEIQFEIHVEAGRSSSLDMLGQDPTQTKRQEAENRGLSRTNGVASIGLDAIEGTKYLKIPAIFPNTQPPKFRDNLPWFSADESGETKPKYNTEKVTLVGDTFAYMFVNLNAQGTVHYVISPSNTGILPELQGVAADKVWDAIPTDGLDPKAAGYKENAANPLVVTYPEVLEIAEHDKYFDKRTYPQQGSFAYNSSGTVPIPVSGLTAETEYYVYFVLEAKTDGSAPGERSQVYVYKFKTAKTTKPRIALDDTRQGIVNIRTRYSNDADSTLNVSSDLHWIVFMQGQGVSQLSGTFTVPKKDGTIDIKGYGDIDTLLEALTTDYDAATAYGVGESGGPDKVPDNAAYGTEYDGLTVFDVFATTAQRQFVENLVRKTPAGTGKVKEGDAQTRPTDFTAEADWVTGGDNVFPEPNEYLILVAGHNIGSKAGNNGEWAVDSFRAYNGVVLQDLAAPSLAGANRIGGYVQFDTNAQGAASTISGSISLHFTKDVYWRNSGKDYEVTKGDQKTEATDTTNATVGILHNISNSSIKSNLTTSGGPQDFTIDFEDIPLSGTYFDLLTNGNIAAYKGNLRTDRLNVRIGREYVTEKIGNDTRTGWRPYFVVTFGSEGGQPIYGDTIWDGGGSTIITNPTVPALQNITVMDTGSGSGYYSFNVGLIFDSGLYYKSGSNAAAVTQLGTGYSATGSDSNLRVSAPVTAGSKTCTVKITSMKVGTITLLPNSTICDATGQASTNEKIKITLSEVSNGPAKVPQVTVTFNGVTKSMQLK